MLGSRDCDVVVIGGGPSGSLAATYLAQRGYHVVLLEKQKHPRPTVGESLIPDFWKYCDEAGVTPLLEAEGFVRKAGGTVRWRDGQVQRVSFGDFGYTRPALHVERDRFDHILVQHARAQGVEIHECITADRIEQSDDGGGQTVVWHDAAGEQGRLRGRQIVDATGQAALAGRQYDSCVSDADFRFVAVWGYFDGADYVAADGSIHPAAEVLTVPPTTLVTSLPFGHGWGWSWHIQLRETTSVGLVVPVDAFRQVRREAGGLEQFFETCCRDQPILKTLLQSAQLIPGSVKMIRDFAYAVRQPASPGCYIIGDASGFIDPIFSIGVTLGMYGARTAAWAIDQSLRRPERAAHCQNLFAAQLQSRFELSRRLALPGYADPGVADADWQQTMQMFSSRALGLMHTVTQMTGRRDNFLAMQGEDFDPALAAIRLHPVEGLMP